MEGSLKWVTSRVDFRRNESKFLLATFLFILVTKIPLCISPNSRLCMILCLAVERAARSVRRECIHTSCEMEKIH